MRGSVGETLDIALPAASVQQFIATLQNDPAIDATRARLQIAPRIESEQSTAVDPAAYVAAVDDARAKATAIARHLSARLGAATAIDEVMSQSGGGYFGAEQPMALPQVRNAVPQMLQAQAGGLVILAVTFSSGVGPISVFGLHAASTRQARAAAIRGVRVDIFASAVDLAAATAEERSADQVVRVASQRFGVHASDIKTSYATLNTY